MKAKHIIILSAALVLSATGFSQQEKIKTGVFLTTDQGETWKPASAGLPEDADISSWAVTRNNTIVITTLNYGFFRSFDGKSWERISKGLPKDILTSTIAVHGSTLFIGSYDKGIFLSRDHGNTWNTSSTGIDNLSIRCFYSQDNTLFAGTDKGIYASANDGISWAHVTGNMQVNDFREVNGVLIAGTNPGTLRSEDRGRTWDWVWSGNALLALATDSVQVSSMGDGNRVDKDQTSDASSTFRITPASPPVLLAPWKNVFRSLRENRPFRNTGLPTDMRFNNILVTPYGILVARENSGC